MATSHILVVGSNIEEQLAPYVENEDRISWIDFWFYGREIDKSSLKLKNGATGWLCEPEGEPTCHYWANVARKVSIDFEGIEKRYAKLAAEHWDKARAARGALEWYSWESIRKKLENPRARVQIASVEMQEIYEQVYEQKTKRISKADIRHARLQPSNPNFS